ncbi:unnamed protein product, partial [Meganyctiphanes norvegica]
LTLNLAEINTFYHRIIQVNLFIMDITVQCFNGEIIQVNVSPNDKVCDLRRKIKENEVQEGIWRSVLVYNHRELNHLTTCSNIGRYPPGCTQCQPLHSYGIKLTVPDINLMALFSPEHTPPFAQEHINSGI